MNKRVLSIDQMNHLKELDLNLNKTYVYWIRIVRPITHINEKEKVIIDWTLSLNKEVMHTPLDVVEIIPTFTLQDILEILPYKIVTSYLNIGKKSFSGDILFYVEYSNFGGYAVSHFRNENIIDAAYEMLCWCIENKYVV